MLSNQVANKRNKPSAKSLANLIPPKKGEVRNPWGPGGKGKAQTYLDFVRTCREHTPEAMAKILDILRNSTDKLSLEAAKFVIERGWGKSPLEIKHTNEDKFRQMSDEELNERVREIMNQQKIINAKVNDADE